MGNSCCSPGCRLWYLLWCLFVLSFFPRDALDEILNLIQSVSEGFPTYSFKKIHWKLWEELIIHMPGRVAQSVGHLTRKSWVLGSIPSLATYFRFSFRFFKKGSCHYWRKYVHEVLVNRLGGLCLPRKSVVRLTDRPDMTLDVYRGRKTTMQQQQQQRLHILYTVRRDERTDGQTDRR